MRRKRKRWKSLVRTQRRNSIANKFLDRAFVHVKPEGSSVPTSPEPPQVTPGRGDMEEEDEEEEEENEKEMKMNGEKTLHHPMHQWAKFEWFFFFCVKVDSRKGERDDFKQRYEPAAQ